MATAALPQKGRAAVLHRKNVCLWKTSEPGAAGFVLWKLYGKNKETPPELTQLLGAAGFVL